MDPAVLWAVVVIGGPALLGAMLLIGKLRSGRKARDDDPSTPSDDPSKGMTGHD